MTAEKKIAGGGGARPGGDVKPSVVSGPTRGSREVWVEVPSQDGLPAAWCYSDKRVYRPGERVGLHLSTTARRISVRIYRDAGDRPTVHTGEPVDAHFHAAPERAYEQGCGWPELLGWEIPADLASGGYIVEIRSAEEGRTDVLGHHLVIVRAAARTPKTIALVAATSTWAAYNDWGGANHYFGINPGVTRGRSPVLSAMRPWARGQIWLPDDAPRSINSARPRRPGPARYDFAEWANLNGYSKYFALAGWATFERPFLEWAELEGHDFHIFTQDELHAGGVALLRDYACTVFVGHDEYWSRDMRLAIDSYIEGGGRVARFAGNFFWQIRLEDGGQRQVSYKYDAAALDPVAGTGQAHTLTSTWDHPPLDYPGASTFGVTGSHGIYAGFGGMARRAARGFNVFRPRHWSFEKTGLAYADMFGDEANIFGFEMDGVDYTFRDGLPEPTFTDGAPPGLQILAMNFATLAESGLPEHDYSLMLGDGDARFKASLSGEESEEAIERHSRGSGMVVSFTRGAGEVYTAGTCEWVNGLIEGDFYTQQITRNVLRRFSAR